MKTMAPFTEVESRPLQGSERVDILLVDDTESNLLALEAILSPLGQNIVKARSGTEALKILLKRDFALILLDINMPGMDGFEAASLIRKRKNSEFTPIIFVTAHSSSDSHKNLGYSLGAVDYIFSPVVPEVLQSKVSVFVELHRKTSEIRQLNENLKAHARLLEQKVEERTQELSRANELLKMEIQERLQAEQKLKEANEELIRLNKIKSEFTSMVSHELRTPLTAIKEGIDLVLEGVDGPVTEEQISTLSISKVNVARLANLIQNVLNFSKLESGRLDIFFDQTPMKALMAEVYRLMGPIAARKGVQLAMELPKEDIQAVCDADKIRQLAINLIDNAVKFTPKGGKVTARLAKKRGTLFIEVEDTGVGIQKGDHEKIFEMFTQASSLQANPGGVGIGLAVCKQVAEQHQGRITVESAVDKGSKFSFSFPLRSSMTAEGPENGKSLEA